MGLASPRNIGIVAIIAVAAGLVPGVPGLIGGAPAEDAAAALPPAPEIVEVETGEPVGPDDGLIRLIVTPAPAADPAAPSGTEPSTEPERPDDDRSGESPRPDPSTGAEGDDGSADESRSGAPERDQPDATDATPRGSRTADSAAQGGSVADEAPLADAETVIDPDVLSALTDGAVLRLDRQNRPWAVFGDGTRVPLFPSGDGARRLAQREAAADAARARAEDAAVADAEAEAADSSADLAAPAAEPAEMPTDSVGHPLMDRIATLSGVSRVVALGDGTYAVTLEDPAVLEGLDVEVAEDIAMGIGSEPYEGYQWALDNTGSNLDGVDRLPGAATPDADIDGVEARTGATGRGVVVAVIDSGVDFSHPDLARAQWINDDEDCANGIDDDANGFVDDCHGWDFAYEDDTPFNRGAHAHGTHVAGIIAASIDGQGIAGVAPDAEIMDLNVGTITASGQPGITMSAVARAIRYATDNGADIINLSLGTSPGSPREASAPVESAIRHAEANDVLVVAAAGNDGVSLDTGPGWPAGYEMSNMITVGASGPSDGRPDFSNWGTVVDLFAPGRMILSTVPVADGGWKFMSGTSQATPMVAAAAALVLDDVAGLPPAEVRARLIAAADHIEAILPAQGGGNRLNAAVAVGVGSNAHRLSDVVIDITGLAAVAVGEPVEAQIDIAVPDRFAPDDAYSWHATLFASLPEGVAMLTGHEVRVDGRAHQSDDLGAVDLGIEGSDSVSLATQLPAGSYALMLEAVPEDDPGQRLGAPKIASFTVGSAETDAAGDVDRVAASRPDASPTERGDLAPGSRGSRGAGDAQAGSSPSAGSGSGGGAGSGGSSGTADAPARGSNGGGGGASATGETVTGGGAGGSRPSSTGATSSGGSPQVTVEARGRGGEGPGGSASSGSGGRGASGSSNAGTGPTVDEPPAPPAPIASGEWAIEVVSPHYGPVGATTTVQIIGRFPSSSYVWFGDRAGTVLVASDRMMVVLAPAQAAAGAVDISLRRTGEGTVLTQPGGFTYLAEPGSSRGGGAGSSDGDGRPAGANGSASAGAGGSTAPDGGSAPGVGGGDQAREPGGPGGDAVDGGGGVATPGPGGERADDGEQADSAGGASASARLDARQSRGRSGGEVVDLGNGLRGVLLGGDDPLARAPSCTSDPCRI